MRRDSTRRVLESGPIGGVVSPKELADRPYGAYGHAPPGGCLIGTGWAFRGPAAIGPLQATAPRDRLRLAATAGGGEEAHRLEAYIQANWDRPLTIEAVAAACGVSVRSVFLQFKKRHALSPAAYIRQVRLAQSRRLLMTGDPAVSVIDAAMRCGFSSFGHYARRYRESFGELPSETLARSRAGERRDLSPPG